MVIGATAKQLEQVEKTNKFSVNNKHRVTPIKFSIGESVTFSEVPYCNNSVVAEIESIDGDIVNLKNVHREV